MDAGEGSLVQGVPVNVLIERSNRVQVHVFSFCSRQPRTARGTEEGRCGSNPYELIRVGT